MSEGHANASSSSEWTEDEIGKLTTASDFSEENCFDGNGTGPPSSFCPATWDSFYCWPSTPAGRNVSRPCALIFGPYNVPFDGRQQGEAHRICTPEGQWLGNWTNYNQCVDLLGDGYQGGDASVGHLTVSYVMLVCSSVSLVTLCVTLAIFCHFKSLQCSRLRVHRNLVSSLIVHSILMIVIPSAVIFPSGPAYTDHEWLCRGVLCLKMYSAMSCINWMFVEGLLLHSRIAVAVFRRDAPFRLYYVIGWGLPLVFVGSWAFAMSRNLQTRCWKGYGKSHYVWILTGPMVVALVVNSVFMVNIVRILITKLNRGGAVDNKRLKTEEGGRCGVNWKAVKATALLFPLLGLTHLMFCINPKDDALLEEAYMLTNALLQSSQGFFVSLLYCFMNTEVQTAVRNCYLRALIRHNPNHRRTRSLNPRTSTAFLSHTEVSVGVQDVSRHKVAPSTTTLLPLREINGGDATRTRVF